MSTRQVSFTNTLRRLGSPKIGAPIILQLRTPNNVVAQNLESGSIQPGATTQVTTSTASDGTYTIGPADYTGDLTPANSWYWLSEDGSVVLIKGVAYSGSPVAVAPLYSTPGIAGTLLMGIKLIDIGSVAQQQYGVDIAISERAQLPDGHTWLYPGQFKHYDPDTNGIVTLNMPPTSGLTPSDTKYYLRWANGTIDTFSVPDQYSGFIGTWSSVTNYHVHTGMSGDPSDVVLLSGVYYRSVADSLNHTPPNVTYWEVLPYEDMLWHLGGTAGNGQLAIPAAGVSAVATVPGSLVGSPQSVQDLESNALYIAAYGNEDTTAVSSTPYVQLATDKIIAVDATAANAVVNLLPASGVRREVVFVKTDSTGHTVTLTADTGLPDHINGATTKVLSAQYDIVKLVPVPGGYIFIS